MPTYDFIRRRRAARDREAWQKYHLFWAASDGFFGLLALLLVGFRSTMTTILIGALLVGALWHLALYVKWTAQERSGADETRGARRQRT